MTLRSGLSGDDRAIRISNNSFSNGSWSVESVFLDAEDGERRMDSLLVKLWLIDFGDFDESIVVLMNPKPPLDAIVECSP